MPKRHKQENKHLSVSENQPLNFRHSFHFLAKIGLSKCHLVAKNSRGEQLRNMNEVYFKDKGTWLLLDFTSSLKGRTCNLRRTTNLKKEGGEHAGMYLEFLKSSLSCLFTAASQSALLLLMLQTGRQLTFQVLACQGTINHLCLTSSAWSHFFLSTVGIITGERKWVKHEYGPLYPSLGAQSPAYAVAAGVPQCHPFLWEASTCCIKLVRWRWKITVHEALQAVVLLHKYVLITKMKKCTIN